MSVLKLTADNFKDFISNKKVIIDFSASWCSPCNMLGSLLDELDEELKLNIGKVDVDECEDIAQAFNITSVPTIFILEDGKILRKRTGFVEKNILKEWIIND